MAKITNFEDVKLELKQHLRQYLEDNGVEVKNNQFRCIHPEHNDEHPSCSILENERWYCFSCGERGDIFDACYYLENKPSNGPMFISQTLVHLAEKYGSEVITSSPTESERRRIETYNAYHAAANYVASHPSEKAADEIRSRGWNLVEASKRGIGSVDSTEAFVQHLVDAGFERSFLEEIDLVRPGLFNENNLIFTVHDHHGRPCGFASKNLLWERGAKLPDGRKVAKYINSRNTDTDVKCNIYDKGTVLYNLHNAKKEPGTVYVFEGYTDVETAIQAGIKKVICVGGTAFTEHHAATLKSLGQTDITLVLDGDEAGQKRTNKIIKLFSDRGEFRLKVICIPGDMDPDDYLREYGPEMFSQLKVYTAFEWMLEQFDDRIDPAIICAEMTKIIATEPLSTQREVMARTLAKKVPYSVNAILSDVDGILRADEIEKMGQRQTILDSLTINLKKYPADWRLSVQSAVEDLENIEASYIDETFNKNTYIKQVNSLKEREENIDDTNQGYRLGDWTELERALRGDWVATFNLVGGAANTGKTGFMANLAERIEDCNKDRDVVVLFQTIDDTFAQFMSRLVAIKARKYYPGITLNKIKKPKGIPDERDVRAARDRAYQEILSLADNERLIIKSGEERGGNTLKFTRDWIRYFKQRNPKKEVILFLDNFHRLGDYAGHKDERVRFKLLSSELKKIAKDLGATIWATVEYVKAAGISRPNNSDISESVAMEYDANFIMHVFNELHVRREEAEVYHERLYVAPNQTQEVTEKLPTIEGIVGKNKITEFKGSLFWDFFPSQASFVQQSRELIKERKERISITAGTERTIPQGAGYVRNSQPNYASPRI